MMKLLHRFRFIAYAVMALFSASLALHAQSPAANKAAARAAKVSVDLLTVINDKGINPQPSLAEGIHRVNLFMTQGNSIAINAVANSEQEGQALLQSLQVLGLSKGRVFKQQVSGYLPIDKLGDLKNVSVLRFARPSYKPIHSVGAVTSQGDTSLRSNIARTTYNVDGTGVKVGVLSDSYDRLGGAASGIVSGDLPMGIEVLKEFSGDGGSDEGRAMIELIHDVAPGSPQAFYTAFEGELDFAAGIRALAVAGCKIITDDVSYFASPFFQDGVVAQAVDDVVNNSGVTYFSAAGNSARQSYQSAYLGTTQPVSPGYYVGAHDFGGGDKFQSLTIAPGQQIIISFQWDDPFFSVSGGSGARTDMDLLVYINGAFQGGLSSQSENIGDDPVEIIGLANNGSTTGVIELVFAKYEDETTGSTPNPTLVKWVNFGSNVPTEYDTKSSTIIGHSNASKAIATGAAPFYNTPAYDTGLSTATIEPFSSAGGTPILFSTDGTRLGSPVVRQKPEITSVDGGNTTFFFSDTSRDTDAFPNFFGTSAAAPHAAGVAALMKQKVPSISPAAILTALKNTALDMDDPFTPGFDTGFDFGTGFGFIQADKALEAIAPGILPLTVTLTANPTTILTTETTTLTATVTGGTAPYNYTFTGPGTITPSGNTATVSGLPVGMQTFNVNVTDGSTPTQTVSGMVSVTVNEPTTGDFAITGVTTVSCSPVPGNPNQRSLTFTPQYSGVNGQPITFSVANESIPTTAPGPYTLGIYIDNPTITLKATQEGTSGEVSFAYNWLAVCGITPTNTPPTVANAIPNQTATVGTAFSYMIPTNTFTDAETPNQLILSVSGLPAGLTFTAPATISGTPTTSGMSSVMVMATDPGTLSTSTMFTITVNSDPTSFAITGVTTVSCSPVPGNPNQRSLTFTPQYSGVNGQPITFSVANESIPTTAPGPYTLGIYIDNPTITLKATQQGTSGEVSFAYNWLAVCGSSSARLGAESDTNLQVLLLGNPVQDGRLSVLVSGVANQPVNMSLIDIRGKVLSSHQIERADHEERHVFEVSRQPTGLLLLKVSTPTKTKTIKVLKVE